jgi:hypothetical protein
MYLRLSQQFNLSKLTLWVFPLHNLIISDQTESIGKTYSKIVNFLFIYLFFEHEFYITKKFFPFPNFSYIIKKKKENKHQKPKKPTYLF